MKVHSLSTAFLHYRHKCNFTVSSVYSQSSYKLYKCCGEKTSVTQKRTSLTYGDLPDSANWRINLYCSLPPEGVRCLGFMVCLLYTMFQFKNGPNLLLFPVLCSELCLELRKSLLHSCKIKIFIDLKIKHKTFSPHFSAGEHIQV